MKLFGSVTELLAVKWRKDGKELTSRPNQATTYTADRDIQLPPGDTAHVLVSESATQTLTNKTLTSPVINSPTGIVKGDVGLGNVDNTSDATKNAATATLTNKTLTSPVINSPTGITKSDVGLGNVDNTSDATKNAATATLTNKTLTTPVINSPTGIVKGDVGLGNVDNTSDATKNAATVTLTNKTITSPAISNPTVSGTLLLRNASGAQPELALSEDPDNGTNIVTIKAPAALAADYVLTLPIDDGTANQVLQTDGSGVLSWASASAGNQSVNSAAGTASQTVTGADSQVRVYTNTASITVTLDTTHAVGRPVTIINNGTANILVNANNAALIMTVYPGTSNTLMTMTATPANPAAWKVFNKVSSGWIADSSSFVFSAAFGTITNKVIRYKRDGKDLVGEFKFRAGTVAASTASFTIPSGLTIPFGTAPSYSTDLQSHMVGTVSFANTAADVGIFADSRSGALFIDSGSTSTIFIARFVNNFRYETVAGSALFANTSNINFIFRVQINEWSDFSG